MAMEPSATPAMVVDARTVLRNVARLAEYAETHELDVRPHTKTHKSRQIADLQMAAGAIGLTAAKVGEAQLMSEVADDILLAYPAIDPARTARLVQLAAHATLRVAVDSIDGARLVGEAANRHSATVGILVDLDVGLHRTGVQSPGATLKIAQYVDSTAGLRLDGLFCYPGHINAPPGDQEPALTAVADQLAETLRLWYDHGLQARIVSGGSDRVSVAPGDRLHRDSARHLCVQRYEHRSRRILQAGRLRCPHYRHGREHCRAGAGRHRCRQQNADQ
jgi:D-serine deaminase-like pyridoxal phosphate-dependent protein